MTESFMPKTITGREVAQAWEARKQLDYVAFSKEASARQDIRLKAFQAACPKEYEQVAKDRASLKASNASLETAIAKAKPQEFFERNLDRLLSAAVFCVAYYGNKKVVSVGGTHITGYASAEAVRTAVKASLKMPAVDIADAKIEVAVKAKA